MKKEKKFFTTRNIILLAVGIIVLIGIVVAGVKYGGLITGDVGSESQAREEIISMSKEVDDLSSTIESIDEELK